MATNQIRYIGNLRIPGASPLRVPLKFNSGTATPVKQGEFLELDTGVFVPLPSDKSMSGTVAISETERRSGDLAGFQYGIVPDEDDLFVVSLSAASNPSIGASVYWASSQTVALSGSNVLGYVVDGSHYPIQGSQSVAPSPDAGVTIPSISQVVIVIKKSVSYNATLRA